MSHLVKIRTQVREPDALRRAAARAGGTVLDGSAHRVEGSGVTGIGVKVPGLHSALVFDTATGEMGANADDRYGRNQGVIDGLLQMYAAEAIRLQAERAGQLVTETELPDGSLELVVTEVN